MKAKHLPCAYAAAYASSWSIVHLYLLSNNVDECGFPCLFMYSGQFRSSVSISGDVWCGVCWEMVEVQSSVQSLLQVSCTEDGQLHVLYANLCCICQNQPFHIFVKWMRINLCAVKLIHIAADNYAVLALWTVWSAIIWLTVVHIIYRLLECSSNLDISCAVLLQAE